MPKRRNVTPEELAKIMKLRETSTSWSQIERDTKVPRHIARRAFEERQLKVSREELKAARQTVAAEDLRWHIGCLIKVAESLVAILDIPSFSDVRSADNILLDLWGTDILGEDEARLSYKQPTPTHRRRIRHQRLFKSLRDHTCEKIDWRNLDNWETAWDSCKGYRDKLKKEAQEIFKNKLKGSEGEHKIEQMGDGIVYVLWRGILLGKLEELIGKLEKLKVKEFEADKEEEIPKMLKDEIASSIRAVPNSEGKTEIIFGKSNPISVPIVAQGDEAKKVIKICTEVCDTLCRQDNVKSVINEFKTMKKSRNHLEKRLDPIFLRPWILNSPKCELCPA